MREDGRSALLEELHRRRSVAVQLGIGERDAHADLLIGRAVPQIGVKVPRALVPYMGGLEGIRPLP